MLIAKRWITLPEIRQRVFQYLLESENSVEDVSELEAKANQVCWTFCNSSKKVFLHDTGNKAIEYPKTYVEPPEDGLHLRANELIDLTIGIPGSGTKKFVAVGKGAKIYDVAGPYIRSPVVFNRIEFEEFFKVLGGGTKPPKIPEEKIKKQLLEKYKAGEYTNKEAEWEDYKALVTWRTFNAAFKAAKKENPAFGKVGRPPKKNHDKNPDS